MTRGPDAAAQQTRHVGPKQLEPEPIGALTWLLVAVALIPVVVAIVRVLTGSTAGFHATSDNALNELMVRDVGRHPVLLGPYSRDGWSHPGPFFYYLSALPYRLFGARSSAMLADALVINGLAIGTTVTIAKRWGGLAMALPVVLLEGLLIITLPLGFLQDPWNPFITVLPFGAFLMVAWAATCGDRWAYPLAAFIGSFCVQTHIGYASLVLAVLVWCGWRAWRDRATDGVMGLWWALATLAVVWFAPLYQQIAHWPGNVSAIVHYFRSTTEPAHSLADGVRVVAAQFTLTPDWLVGLRDVNPFSGQPAAILATPVPVLLVPFGFAAAVVVRSGDRRWRRLVAVQLICLGVGVVTLAQTVGSMYEYRLRWIWVLAGLCMALTLGQAARVLGPRLERTKVRAVTAACVAATVALGGFGVARVASYEPRDAGETRTLAALSTAVLRHLPNRPGVVLLRASGVSSSTYLPGLVLVMEQSGVRVHVTDQLDYRRSFGDHRVYRRESLRARLQIASNREIETVASQPGAHLIAYASDVSRVRRARALRSYNRLHRQGVKDYEKQIADLAKFLSASAVFSLPIAGDPAPSSSHDGP